MTGAEIIILLQLISALTPEAIKMYHDISAAFTGDTTLTTDERLAKLNELASSLKPMTLKE